MDADILIDVMEKLDLAGNGGRGADLGTLGAPIAQILDDGECHQGETLSRRTALIVDVRLVLAAEMAQG